MKKSQEIIGLSNEEKSLINELLNVDLDFNNLSDDEIVLIEETLGDRLTLYELGEDYKPTEIGQIIENILFKMPNIYD